MDPLNAQDQAKIKDAFWGYNGRAQYQTDWAVANIGPGTPGYEGSAYVMTGWDALRSTMEVKIFDTAGNEIDSVPKSTDGAWKVFVLLKKATYDSGGLITAINESCSTDAPSDTSIPFGCPLDNAVVGNGNLFGSQQSYGLHQGIDMHSTAVHAFPFPLDLGDGSPVYATMSGRVDLADTTSGTVIIKNFSFITYITKYLHMYPNLLEVAVGDTVNRGQIIGYQGNFGNSSGSHLHYEVWKNGLVQNPIEYVQGLTNTPEGECHR
jgi:murein DD-endopeptidase MepM/ murein hydrolase activator NlpD